jgi:hypothetical protein
MECHFNQWEVLELHTHATATHSCANANATKSQSSVSTGSAELSSSTSTIWLVYASTSIYYAAYATDRNVSHVSYQLSSHVSSSTTFLLARRNATNRALSIHDEQPILCIAFTSTPTFIWISIDQLAAVLCNKYYCAVVVHLLDCTECIARKTEW